MEEALNLILVIPLGEPEETPLEVEEEDEPVVNERERCCCWIKI
jgi:hypothetical protein